VPKDSFLRRATAQSQTGHSPQGRVYFLQRNIPPPSPPHNDLACLGSIAAFCRGVHAPSPHQARRSRRVAASPIVFDSVPFTGLSHIRLQPTLRFLVPQAPAGEHTSKAPASPHHQPQSGARALATGVKPVVARLKTPQAPEGRHIRPQPVRLGLCLAIGTRGGAVAPHQLDYFGRVAGFCAA
jgi:hypothetical protein